MKEVQSDSDMFKLTVNFSAFDCAEWMCMSKCPGLKLKIFAAIPNEQLGLENSIGIGGVIFEVLLYDFIQNVIKYSKE